MNNEQDVVKETAVHMPDDMRGGRDPKVVDNLQEEYKWPQIKMP